MLQPELMDEESTHINGELMILFFFFLHCVQNSPRAPQQLATSASAEVTSTDRSGSAERPSQLISHQHPPFHNQNVVFHSRMSAERRR